MYAIRFYFIGSERFIWIGEHKLPNKAKGIAEKFLKKNCSSWKWSETNEFLARGTTTDLPTGVLLVITKE
jgi:hypothetical protein